MQPGDLVAFDKKEDNEVWFSGQIGRGDSYVCSAEGIHLQVEPVRVLIDQEALFTGVEMLSNDWRPVLMKVLSDGQLLHARFSSLEAAQNAFRVVSRFEDSEEV